MFGSTNYYSAMCQHFFQTCKWILNHHFILFHLIHNSGSIRASLVGFASMALEQIHRHLKQHWTSCHWWRLRGTQNPILVISISFPNGKHVYCYNRVVGSIYLWTSGTCKLAYPLAGARSSPGQARPKKWKRKQFHVHPLRGAGRFGQYSAKVLLFGAQMTIWNVSIYYNNM